MIKKTASKNYADSVENAKLMLAFASRRGIRIENSIIEIVTKANPDEALSDDDEVKFWGAFGKLASAVAPATPESIYATTDRSKNRYNPVTWLPLLRNKTIAERTMLYYTFWTVVTFFVLVGCQIYLGAGTSIVNKISHHEKAIRELEATVNETRPALLTSSRSGKNLQNSRTTSNLNNAFYLLNMQHAEMAASLRVSYDCLNDWYHPYLYVKKRMSDTGMSPHTTDKQPPEKEKNRPAGAVTTNATSNNPAHDPFLYYRIEEAKMKMLEESICILNVLEKYVLPALYGFLGAFVYILRALLISNKSYSFTRTLRTNYRVRSSLGMLSGLVIGCFITPDASDNLAVSISPFALAFVAGYSIDLFFALVDKIVSTFTTEGIHNLDSGKAPKKHA